MINYILFNILKKARKYIKIIFLDIIMEDVISIKIQ
jgi:hypothetical protein